MKRGVAAIEVVRDVRKEKFGGLLARCSDSGCHRRKITIASETSRHFFDIAIYDDADEIKECGGHGASQGNATVRISGGNRICSMDVLDQFKANQKVAWANFAILESTTATAAPHLVRFAGIRAGQKVLDVACGTGVVALTAARLGAQVQGLDLTPELIERARENAALMKLDAAFQEGDAEALPFPDAAFDVVVSQFGHIFAPRPDVTIAGMLRVLKPGGTIAFSTWPPELMVGGQFAIMGRYAPPPPPGVSPPAQWGDPNIVRERLGASVKEVMFTRATILLNSLSPQHFRVFMTENFGPAKKLVESLTASDPSKAAQLNAEIEALAQSYFHDNQLRQDFLITRAIKK